MAINPKKLEAFANKKKGKGGGGGAPPFGGGGGKPGGGKGGNPFGKKNGGGGQPHHDEEDEPEHEHDEEGEDEIDVEAIGERVQNGKGDKRLMRLAEDVDDENNPPEWVEDEDKWEKAKDTAEPHWDDWDEPYAVVAHIYQALGGGIKKGDGG